MKLTLPLEIVSGSNAAFVIPDEVVEKLGGGGRPKVVATVGAGSFRTSVARMGGRYLLGVNKARREECGIEPGQTYDLTVELDTAERTVEVPDDLAAALAKDTVARTAWEAWSFTRRKEAADSLTGAKKAETRDRRLAATLSALRGE